MTDLDDPPSIRTRRRLVQVRPALVLASALVLIAGVPTVLADALVTPNEDPVASGPVVLESVAGQPVDVVPPAGWTVRDRGSSVTFRSGPASVSVEVYDRGGRDVDAMAERLRRLDRLRGLNAAPDGGEVRTADDSLGGASCLLTGVDTTGVCAVLADDDDVVVVMVQTTGTPDDPALPLTAVLAGVSRGETR